jgi:hypothetical protein
MQQCPPRCAASTHWRHHPAKPPATGSITAVIAKPTPHFTDRLIPPVLDTRTRDYLAHRTTECKTRREAIRCIKRYLASEVYQIITSHTNTAVRGLASIASVPRGVKAAVCVLTGFYGRSTIFPLVCRCSSMR